MVGAPDSARSFGMTDLEEVLMSPDGEAARRDALACLDSSLAQVDARLLAGLDPRQMTRARAVRDALDTARAMLLKFQPLSL
jgi:hypothetical protein